MIARRPIQQPNRPFDSGQTEVHNTAASSTGRHAQLVPELPVPVRLASPGASRKCAAAHAHRRSRPDVRGGGLRRGDEALEFVEPVLDHNDVIAGIDLGRGSCLFHHEKPYPVRISPIVGTRVVALQDHLFR